MTEHIKTPELRFSNFLDMWHIHKLSDVATITGGGTPSTKVSEYWDGEIDWYTPNEIGERIYARGSKKKITNLGYKKSSTKLLPINTILFTSRAGIGNTAILAKEGCTNQGFQSIIPNSEKIDSYFIYTISNHIKKYALKHAAGSTFLEISGKELGKMKLFLPSLTEQQKIGVFFSKLDQQIELEEKKLELLEQQKKGYMQKIFSQELRFKDENGNKYPKWTNTLIKDLFINKGGTALEKEFENNGDYKVISIGSYSMNSTYNDQNLRINKNEKTEKYILSQGDLAMVLNDKTKDGNIIGRSIFIDKDNHYIYNQRTERLIPLSENDNKFLWFLMNTDIVRNKIKSMMQGATQVYINYSSIKNISLQIPSFEEQIKIREFLEVLLHSITKQDNKVKLLKQRKQGLLQKMFV